MLGFCELNRTNSCWCFQADARQGLWAPHTCQHARHTHSNARHVVLTLHTSHLTSLVNCDTRYHISWTLSVYKCVCLCVCTCQSECEHAGVCHVSEYICESSSVWCLHIHLVWHLVYLIIKTNTSDNQSGLHTLGCSCQCSSVKNFSPQASNNFATANKNPASCHYARQRPPSTQKQN